MAVEFMDAERLFYDLDADSLVAVAAAISQKDEAAWTEWFPNYEYNMAGDELADAAVTVRTKITMPRWIGCSSAHQWEKDEWDRFSVALQAHEQGHIELVVQQFSDIDERLVGKSIASAKRTWEQALDALQSASRAYDQQTNHGLLQGTVIDASGGNPASE